jgi:hypothetical protein
VSILYKRSSSPAASSKLKQERGFVLLYAVLIRVAKAREEFKIGRCCCLVVVYNNNHKRPTIVRKNDSRDKASK